MKKLFDNGIHYMYFIIPPWIPWKMRFSSDANVSLYGIYMDNGGSSFTIYITYIACTKTTKLSYPAYIWFAPSPPYKFEHIIFYVKWDVVAPTRRLIEYSCASMFHL